MVSQGLFGNLGDPGRSPVAGVVADKPKRRGSHDDAPGSRTKPYKRRSQGNVWREHGAHSKGLAATRRARGRQDRNGDRVQTKLKLITSRAQRDRGWRFSSLAYLLGEGFLAQCFMELRRGKAPGIDGVRWEEYAEKLTENLRGLVSRLKAKRHWPQPARGNREYKACLMEVFQCLLDKTLLPVSKSFVLRF